VFRLAPVAGLVCVAAACILVCPSVASPGWGFEGDLVFFAYCLGLARFLTVAAALDTGSSFEGMGASREVLYSALAEPALLIGLAVLARVSGSMSLAGIFNGLGGEQWMAAGTALALVAVSFLIVLLAENSRIPFDDPNTHLELTMIHEVMVLDSSGPDFAMIGYGASLKLWLFGALIVSLVLTPFELGGHALAAAFLAGMLLVGILVGTVESVMARLSLTKTPQLLAGAGALSVLAFLLSSRFLQ
jgi:formate hydrogenlyase subunit 4